MWLWVFSIANGSQLADSMRLGDCAAVFIQTKTCLSNNLQRAMSPAEPELGASHSNHYALNEGVVGDYARWVRAQAHLERNEPLKAAEALKQLELPGDLQLKVRLARGRALVLAGRSLEAREGLRELLNTSEGIEARYWLAKGGQDRGESQAAIATFRRVWTHGVRGQWDERAAERLKSLGHLLSTRLPNSA